MAESDTILQLGIEAAREGNREEARNLFSLLTRQEPNNVQAWLWLAGVAEGPEERRAALEKVLALDPQNDMAARGLQAMGVAPTSTPPVDSAPPVTATPDIGRVVDDPLPDPDPIPATTAPYEPPRSLSEEEQYAAELDSAFDDYDMVEKVGSYRNDPTGARDATDTGETVSAAARPTSARERVAARRTMRDSSYDDDDDGYDDGNRRSGPSPLLLGLLGGIVLVLLACLAFNYFNGRRGATPIGTGATQTAGAVAGGSTATSSGTISNTNGLSSTGSLTDTGGVAGSGSVTDTTGLTNTGTVTDTGTPAGGENPQPTAQTQPPAAGNLGQANPAAVNVGDVLQVNNWSYTFPNAAYAAVLGKQVGGFTANGQYVLVLVNVANGTGADQPLPADFLVLKDAQGNAYVPQPQVSSAYVIRGVNADIGQEDAVPANGLFTSVPLIFDVPSGASNLVLFSSAKTDQGWTVLNVVP